MERIQKLIAQAGITSRRKAEQLIVDGRVKVNGKKVTELGTKASVNDLIEVDGVPIRREEKVYFLMNKPKYCLSSVSDDRGRETVIDYLGNVNARVFPVGRLDFESTGLLLLTNDGDFANKMIHPSYHLPKTYECAISGELTEDEMRQLRKGIMLEDGKTLPAKVHVLKYNANKNKTIFEITIFEGRNREIRRMMEFFHHEVTRLDRKQFGFLDYGTLRQGESRRLRMFEVKQLIEFAETGEVKSK